MKKKSKKKKTKKTKVKSRYIKKYYLVLDHRKCKPIRKEILAFSVDIGTRERLLGMGLKKLSPIVNKAINEYLDNYDRNKMRLQEIDSGKRVSTASEEQEQASDRTDRTVLQNTDSARNTQTS